MKKDALFFIAIVPPEPVQERITSLKLEVAERFGSSHALNAPPHITLHMPFRWRSDRTDTLLNLVQEINADLQPFEVRLNGFDFFEPRVVFVAVKNSTELNKLQSKVVLKCRRELHLDNADYKDRPFHPHVTIGFRDLRKLNFYEAKAYYEGKNFKAHFWAGEIQLLHHSAKKWQVVK